MITQSATVTGPLQVAIQVDPARAGTTALRLTYTRGGVTPADVVKVTARWALRGIDRIGVDRVGGDQASGEEVIPVELSRRGVGRYGADRVVLPEAGSWRLAVTTQTSDIDSSTTLFIVDVR